jgi:hypothetical protein
MTALAIWGQASQAPAGPQPGDTEVFVSGGTQHDGVQISIFGVELIPKPGRAEGTSVAVGLTLDHRITPHLGLELDGAYTPRLGEPYEAAVTTATAGLIYHINPTDKGILYLTAGGGVAWFHAADTGIDNDVTGTGVAAIGVKIYPKSRILLRIDFRLFYAPSPFVDQNLLQRSTVGIGLRF